MAGIVQHRLIIFAHGGEIFGADVERVVHHGRRQRHGQPDGFAEVFHVKQLVAVAPVADHRESVARVGPVIKQRKHPKALRPNERFGPDDRHAHPLLAERDAFFFGGNFSAAIRTHAGQFVGLQQRVMVGNAVHRRAGNHDEARHARLLGGRQQIARAIHVRGHDVALGIERQCGGGMNDHAHAVHCARHGCHIADVTGVQFHTVFFGIIKRHDVQRADVRFALGPQVPNQIDSQKPAAARHQNLTDRHSRSFHSSHHSLAKVARRTVSTSKSMRQARSPRRHVRAWHGRQSRPSLTTTPSRCRHGPVRAGSVAP